MKNLIPLLLLTATAALAQDATIVIDASHVENHVSPRMVASFVEMMAEDVKGGMTAEMIHDRSFEDAPDYLGLPAAGASSPMSATTTSAPSASHRPPKRPIQNSVSPATLRTTPFASPSLLATSPTRAPASRRADCPSSPIRPITVTYGSKCPAHDGYTGSITVALEEDNTDGETYSQATLQPASGGNWAQVRFQLTPRKSDRFAKLTFLFGGKGTLFLDQVSLEPATARREVRADSEAMIAKLHPSFMRWPGGNVAQDYHWQWGIGPRDLRPVWINKAWSNAPEPDDLGTDEYLALCTRLGIDPSITVNVEGNGATPEEAAAWVEYVNGPATSKYGGMRAANGHPAPYNVKQWELGNEIFGGWVRGHVTAETYARSAVVYAKAMRAIDPTIKLIAVGEGIMPEQDSWNSAVLRIAGPEIDFLSIHDYTTLSQNASAPNPRAAMMARAGEFERSYHHTGDLIAKLAPSRNIRQIVNEWNLFYDAATIQSMEGAVYAARMMNGFEREGDTVEANCISDLLNGWVGGIIQASRDRVYGTAQFYALKLYADHPGTDRLATTLVSPDLAPGVKSIDAVATRSADGAKLFLKVSNAGREKATSLHIAIKAFPHTHTATLDLLHASTLTKRNSFSKPNALAPTRTAVPCTETCSLTLPPDSVAVLTFTRSNGT